MQTPLRTKRRRQSADAAVSAAAKPSPAETVPAAAKPSPDAALSAAQYCAFCAAEMPFERIEPSDYQIDEPDEWICTKCGSALLIDPPTQPIPHTA